MLFTLFVVVPYFEINFLTDIVLSILFISALIVFSEKRNFALFSMIICISAIASAWASYWKSSTQLEVIANLCEIAFIGIVITAILKKSFWPLKLPGRR